MNKSELISWLAVVRFRNLLFGFFSLHGNKQLVHIKIQPVDFNNSLFRLTC